MRTRIVAAMTFVILAGPTVLEAQLVVDGFQVFDQADLGDPLETQDQFGSALAAGDFDNDGFSDLAIAAPRDDVGASADAGIVHVIYGSASGLDFSLRPPTLLHQDVAAVQDVAEADDRFGTTLVGGDFNGDGFDELVVAVPFEDLMRDGAPWQTDAGALHVFIGGPIGIAPAADIFFTAERFLFLPDEDLGGVETGLALATGRYPATGAFMSLLTGLPAQDFANRTDGAAGGLDPMRIATRPNEWPLPHGAFGSAVALAKVETGTSERANMVVGAPNKPFPFDPGLEGGAVWMQSRNCFPDTFSVYGDQDGQRLGATLAVGRFFGGEYGTVLVSSPGRDVGGVSSAGWVEDYNLSTAACEPTVLLPSRFSQGTPPLSETAEPFDRFGETLAVGDFDNDGLDDAVFDPSGGSLVSGAGLVFVLYGSDPALFRDGFELGATGAWSSASP